MFNNLLIGAAVSSGMDWSSIDFSGVFTEFTKAIPVIIPVVIGFIALRKALAFVMGSIKKA